MLRKLTIPSVLSLAIVLMAFTYGESPVSKDGNKYIGAKKCGMCHKKDKTGNQLEKWEKGPHAKAFAQLATAEAKEIAKANGVEDPQKDAKCLKCHSTGQYEGAEVDKSFKVEDGVQCEACHGPGSEYKSMKTMKDHAASVAAGMTDFTVEEALQETCAKCHEDAAVHATNKDFDFKGNWEKISHMIPKG